MSDIPRLIPKDNSKPSGVRAPDGQREQSNFLSFFPPPVYPKTVGYTRGYYYELPEVVQIPPALRDSLATFQTCNEQELSYLLISDPYGVLKLAGDYLPEVGKRERDFWLLIKKNLPPNLEIEKAIQCCLDLAFKNGYKGDFFRWQDRYMECFFSVEGSSTLSDRAKQLLKEIVAAHNTRESIEIVQGSSRFQRMGDYYGSRD